MCAAGCCRRVACGVGGVLGGVSVVLQGQVCWVTLTS